jgi:hypothetical protein
MAITQLNSYLPGQNLTNLAENVDYNRVGDDKTDITINHTTNPWTFTIKVGSLIEKDGNIYTVDTSDYTLQATDNTHNYIVFTGSAFASSANRGTYDPAKGGFYDSGNRVLKYYIDTDNDLEYTLSANDSRTEDVKTSNLIIDGDTSSIGKIDTENLNSYNIPTTEIYILNETVSNTNYADFTIKKPVSIYAKSGTTTSLKQKIHDSTRVNCASGNDDSQFLRDGDTFSLNPGNYSVFNGSGSDKLVQLTLIGVYGQVDPTVDESDIFA